MSNLEGISVLVAAISATGWWSRSYGRGLSRELHALGADSFTVGWRDIAWFGRSDVSESRLLTKLYYLLIRLVLARPISGARLSYEARRVARFLAEYRVDVIITFEPIPGLPEAASNSQTKVVFWGIDEPMSLGPSTFSFAQECDTVFTYSKGATNLYKENGIRAEWLPLCYDQEVIGPLPPSSSDPAYPIVFVGSDIPDRRPAVAKFLSPVAEKFGRDLHLFGMGWNRSHLRNTATVHLPRPWSDLAHLYAETGLVLGLHRVPASQTYLSINSRVFEALGCRKPLIGDHPVGIEELFAPGTDLEVCDTGREMADLVEQYLSDDPMGEALARQGHSKVASAHTLRHRAETLANAIARLGQ